MGKLRGRRIKVKYAWEAREGLYKTGKGEWEKL
jgi:hypothetical protein